MRKTGSLKKECSNSAGLPFFFLGASWTEGMRKSGSAKTRVPGSLFVAELKDPPEDLDMRSLFQRSRS
jgi:hypothetical protein